MPFRILTFAAVCTAALAPGIQPASAQTLSLLSGSAGGSWYPIGAGLAEVLSEHGVDSAVEEGGGVSNVIALARGQGDIGFTNGFVPSIAADGKEPFDQPYTDIQGLAVLMDNCGQFVVTEESGVTSFPELEGEPFVSLPLSASSTLAFQNVLQAYGMEEDDMEITRGNMSFGAAQIKDRHAIGFHATTAYPNGSISDLAASLPIRFLEVDDAHFQRLREINSGFVRCTIPAGTYEGQEDPVTTVGAPTILIAHGGLAEDTGREIVRALAENMADVNAIHASLRPLTPEKMSTVADLGLELNPGAEAYYSEAGLLD